MVLSTPFRFFQLMQKYLRFHLMISACESGLYFQGSDESRLSHWLPKLTKTSVTVDVVFWFSRYNFLILFIFKKVCWCQLDYPVIRQDDYIGSAGKLALSTRESRKSILCQQLSSCLGEPLSYLVSQMSRYRFNLTLINSTFLNPGILTLYTLGVKIEPFGQKLTNNAQVNGIR